MNTATIIRQGLALCFAVVALSAAAAPNYKPVAADLVIEHLQAANDPASDVEWNKFVAAKKIVGTGLTAACTAALKVGREIIRDGTPADSEYFAAILASSIGVAKPSADRGAAAAVPAAAAAGVAGQPVKAAAGAADPNPFVITAPLREYGFSFSAGGGTVLDGGKSAGLTVFLARYNLKQQRTTARWNQMQQLKVQQNQIRKATQVPGVGPLATSDQTGKGAGENQDENLTAKILTLNNPKKLTFWGPVFGRALGGEKLMMGTRTERPWLLGWGLGYGFGPEASSAIYVDLAATVSPTSGFSRSKPYVGVSFDGVVALKLFQSFGAPLGLGEAK